MEVRKSLTKYIACMISLVGINYWLSQPAKVNVGLGVGELPYLLDFQTSILVRSELYDPDRFVC